MNKLRSKNIQHTKTVSQELSRFLYTPESRLRYPRLLFQQMWQDLLASRELAWQLIVRDINAQYRQSLLGIFWAFIPPILTAAGFTLAKNANVVNLGDTNLPYPAYVMFSTALWQTFTEALNSPLQEVAAAKGMLAKINFPREALILAGLGKVFFNFGIKLILIVALFIWFQMPVTWSAVLAPVALVHLIILGTAIGLLLAPLGTLYQDISKLLTVFLGFWLLLTPVIYSVPKEGKLAELVKLNPVTPLLVTVRELATTGVLSDPHGFWVVSLIAIFGLLVAWLIYKLAMPFIVERMSA
ncbi:MAG: ABC transporter permease [Chlorogloeopsis fritschii C42_A2020_084]|uniref:ABC transporter permease n=1 Tax=Chlorogloeopsis fritschii TaxID=1124 RepID=UPI0019ED89A7|nr:ABC transporter permease [Chlorogloeopsis fritschii]MBF2004213.1 ABC transporter permease [Chlorogloeopsis fritschii C42_A2020_084]